MRRRDLDQLGYIRGRQQAWLKTAKRAKAPTKITLKCLEKKHCEVCGLEIGSANALACCGASVGGAKRMANGICPWCWQQDCICAPEPPA